MDKLSWGDLRSLLAKKPSRRRFLEVLSALTWAWEHPDTESKMLPYVAGALESWKPSLRYASLDHLAYKPTPLWHLVRHLDVPWGELLYLCGQEEFRQLSSMVLQERVTTSKLSALSQASCVESLESLELEWYPTTSADVQWSYKTKPSEVRRGIEGITRGFPRLKTLILSGDGWTFAQLTALRPIFSRPLKTVHLTGDFFASKCYLTDLAAKPWDRLEHLHLCNHSLPICLEAAHQPGRLRPFIYALFYSNAFPRLKSITLRSFPLEDRSLMALLLQSPLLRRLESLDLGLSRLPPLNQWQDLGELAPAPLTLTLPYTA